MEDWYSPLDYPIVPELAITSVPSVESLRKFIPEDELWPPGPSWGHHWADLDRLRMQNYDALGDEKTGSLEEFVNATQDSQGTIFQLAVEHFRRAKPRTSGISLCHFITYWPDMKWGIVDNYQRPKRAYDFVQRAYQPLLVSLQFDRRRWKTNETFEGRLWIVNDAYDAHENCRISVKILNEAGATLHDKSVAVDEIQPDSSTPIAVVDWEIAKQTNDRFFVHLSLLDGQGRELSANEYMLLIGDQEAARARMNSMGDDLSRNVRRYTGGNYYRYFPDIIRDENHDWESDVQIPRARLK